ncbi:hypothetical protein [Polaribacter sp. OB-PA-B3]
MINLKNIFRIFLLVTLIIITGCTKTNWDENYREKEKSPFGNYIISKEAPNLFPDTDVTILKENFYDASIFSFDGDTINKKNYVLIKNAAFKQTKEGTKSLLEFVSKGNSAFISLHYFNADFKEALEFSINNLDKNTFGNENLKKLKGEFYLKHPDFGKKPYLYSRNIKRNYFLQYNEGKTMVLGTTKIDGEEVPNFIKIYHGKGAFYLHTNPIVFTNYYLLKGKTTYVANLLSYLPNNPVLWDEHIKSSEYSQNPDDKPSIFNYFLKHPTLTWFLYISIIGLLLFMLFNARRKQRAVPVIKPIKNTTVAFTQTISNLYLSEEDHKNLVDKKITFFLEKVRSKYLIDTANLNADFIKKLAAKSGNEHQKTKYLIHTIITLNKKTECSKEQLIVLHKMIENFLKK